MRNTGYKQAKIAKRVTWPSSLPINEEGEIIESIEKKLDETDKEFQERKKQAILLLKGEKNPDSSKLKIVGRFNVGDNIQQYQEGGVDVNSETRIYAPDECPVENIKPSPKPEPEPSLPPYKKYPLETRFVEIKPTVETIAIDNSLSPSNAVVRPLWGKDWDSNKSFTGTDTDKEYWYAWNRGTYHTRRVGEQEWTLENFKGVYKSTSEVEIDNTSLYKYIITQEILDDAKIPLTLEENYKKNGLFSFSSESINLYNNLVRVYPERYYKDSRPNLFGKSLIKHLNVRWVSGQSYEVYEDPNATAIIIPIKLYGNEAGYLLSKDIVVSADGNLPSVKFFRSWDKPILGTGTYNPSHLYTTPVNVGGSKISGTDEWSANWALVILDETGKTFEQLPKIKIELVDTGNTNYPTQWIPNSDETLISGWSIPGQSDFLQLFGMVGKDLSMNNLKKHLWVKAVDNEIPWIDNYPNSDKSEDVLGVRFLPIGFKQNDKFNIANKIGIIKNFGYDLSYTTYGSSYKISNNANPSFWMTDIDQTYYVGNNNWDISNVTIPDGSKQYWQRNIRFVRNLTDKELGYKMWRKDSTDEILVTPLANPQPADTQEIPRGLLRGLAVRWFDNRDKPTKVLAPLSHLLSEIEKCKNNGGNRWIGWEWGL